MRTDIGEYIVGAYLKIELGCDVVDYNVRPPGGKINGLNELDVVGYNFKNSTAFICEVTTHIRGLLYGSNQKTIAHVTAKHERQQIYASKYVSKHFKNIRYMFWSPYVPKGLLTTELKKLKKLELYINGEYKTAIETLRKRARKETHDAVNPFFRMLQILEHTRDK